MIIPTIRKRRQLYLVRLGNLLTKNTPMISQISVDNEIITKFL